MSCWLRSPTSTSTARAAPALGLGVPRGTASLRHADRRRRPHSRTSARGVGTLRRRGQVTRERARGAAGCSPPSRPPRASRTRGPPPGSVRRRRRRPDRCRDGRPDRRTGAGHTGRDFRASIPRYARIVLVEAADRVLTSFPPSLSGEGGAVAAAPWRHRPHRPRGDRGRRAASHSTPRRRLGAHRQPRVVWAAGVTASRPRGQLADSTGAESDRAGRVTVEPTYASRHPEVFAIGDMVRVRGRGGEPSLPGVAPVAMQQGRSRPASSARARADPIRRLSLPRQGQPGDDRASSGGRRHKRSSAQRLPRLGNVAARPPLVPDRLPESAARPHPLVPQLRNPRSRRPTHHEYFRLLRRPADAAINDVPGRAFLVTSALREERAPTKPSPLRRSAGSRRSQSVDSERRDAISRDDESERRRRRGWRSDAWRCARPVSGRRTSAFHDCDNATRPRPALTAAPVYPPRGRAPAPAPAHSRRLRA